MSPWARPPRSPRPEGGSLTRCHLARDAVDGLLVQRHALGRDERECGAAGAQAQAQSAVVVVVAEAQPVVAVERVAALAAGADDELRDAVAGAEAATIARRRRGSASRRVSMSEAIAVCVIGRAAPR